MIKTRGKPSTAVNTRFRPEDDEPRRSASEIMADGAKAHGKGKGREANPYHRLRQSALHSVWDMGWTRAEGDGS